MKIPDKLIGYRVYDEGKFIDTADVELPDIEHMTETLTGSGIAGEIETPTLGQIASMTTSINFRTQTKNMIGFLSPDGKMLDIRGSLQDYDSAKGKIVTRGLKVSMLVLPKSVSLGKLEIGNTTDSSTEAEVTYIRIIIDNEVLLEIDKANYIYKVEGIDYLEEVRRQLGRN